MSRLEEECILAIVRNRSGIDSGEIDYCIKTRRFAKMSEGCLEDALKSLGVLQQRCEQRLAQLRAQKFLFCKGDRVQFIGHSKYPHVEPFTGIVEAVHTVGQGTVYVQRLIERGFYIRKEPCVLAFNGNGYLIGYESFGQLLKKQNPATRRGE